MNDEQNQGSTQSSNQSDDENQTTNGTKTSGNQTGNNEENIEELKALLEETNENLTKMTVIAKQALADLQNFRRRAEEDQRSTILYSNAELLKDLLPGIDNINRALDSEPKDANWGTGVTQTLKQIWQILERRNVKAIPTVGQPMDPRMHEVLMVVPGEKDTVIQELEKGYMLGERVIKPARVAVGSGE